MFSRTQHGPLVHAGNALSGLRTLVRLAYVTTLFLFGYLRRARRKLLERGAIVVLTFHRVLDDESYKRSNSLPGIVIREETFHQLLKYLVQQCDPVCLDGAVPGVRSTKLRVAVTFDDGWQDNFHSAFPIARDYGLPFSVFICPGLVGQNAPFWPEQVSALLRINGASQTKIEEVIENLKQQPATCRDAYLESLRKTSNRNWSDASGADQLLTWDDIRKMRAEGVSFGSHTYTHQLLTTISPKSAAKELYQSKSTIEAELGEPCVTFAYPNGDCSLHTRQWVSDAGYSKAVTTRKGAWTAEGDPLSIPRLNVSEGNVTGLLGQFSSMMFEYTTFWWASRALSKSKTHQSARWSSDLEEDSIGQQRRHTPKRSASRESSQS